MALPVSSFTFLKYGSSLLTWLQLRSTQESLSWAGERRGTNMSTVSPADVDVPDQPPAQSWRRGPLQSSANTSIPASILALAGRQRCSQDMVHSAYFF